MKNITKILILNTIRTSKNDTLRHFGVQLGISLVTTSTFV